MKILYTLLAIAIVAGGYVGYTKLNSNSKNINTNTMDDQTTIDKTYGTTTNSIPTTAMPTNTEKVSKNKIKVCNLVSTEEIKNVYGGTVNILSESDKNCMYSITPQTTLSIIALDVSDVSDAQIESDFNNTDNFIKSFIPYLPLKVKPITMSGIDTKVSEVEIYLPNQKVNDKQVGGTAGMGGSGVGAVGSIRGQAAGGGVSQAAGGGIKGQAYGGVKTSSTTKKTSTTKTSSTNKTSSTTSNTKVASTTGTTSTTSSSTTKPQEKSFIPATKFAENF
jgi:hypothetical protein